MMRRPRKGWDSGAAALEMALVAPVFLTFVLGTFTLGWALYCGAEVRHAVERKSRLLIVTPGTTASTLQTAVRAELHAANPNNVNLTMATQTVGAGSIAKLSWTYGYTMNIPFAANPITLNFNSSMVVPLRT